MSIRLLPREEFEMRDDAIWRSHLHEQAMSLTSEKSPYPRFQSYREGLIEGSNTEKVLARISRSLKSIRESASSSDVSRESFQKLMDDESCSIMTAIETYVDPLQASQLYSDYVEAQMGLIRMYLVEVRAKRSERPCFRIC